MFFENCRLPAGLFNRASFVDVRFKGCDFSNCFFEEAYPQKAHQLFLVRLLFHADKIDQDHSREVSQAQLPRDLGQFCGCAF